jgi:hypothetical protein
VTRRPAPFQKAADLGPLGFLSKRGFGINPLLPIKVDLTVLAIGSFSNA